MGRKRLPESAKRSKPLRIPLNDAERELVDAAAKTSGYATTARWVRELIVRMAKRATSDR